MKYFNKFLKHGTPEESKIFELPRAERTENDYKIMSKYYSTKELKERYKFVCSWLINVVRTKEEYDNMNAFGNAMGFGPLFLTWEQYKQATEEISIEARALEKILIAREFDRKYKIYDIFVFSGLCTVIGTLTTLLAYLIFK